MDNLGFGPKNAKKKTALVGLNICNVAIYDLNKISLIFNCKFT